MRAVPTGHTRAGGSLRTLMSYDAYLALGETKHHEYYDGLLYVNPPSRRHVLIARRLTRLFEDGCPEGYEVYPEWGWHAASNAISNPTS